MKHFVLLLSATLAVSACDNISTVDTSDNTAASSVMNSSSSAPATIEKYPTTVEQFQTMTLSGTNLVIGNVLERAAKYTKYYITYMSNGVKISGTLSLPTAEGSHPLIIQNHGYIDPAVYTNGRGLRREQAALASAGFAVLHTDYRKHAQSDPDPDTRNIYDNALAYALDSANAILAVRELNDPRINGTKVGMLGHSMGGGVTLHILTSHPELIDAAVLYAPINADAWANFTRWRIADRPESAPTLAAFKTKDEDWGSWNALSQSGSLKNIDDPVIIFHGTNDKDVPIEWSDNLKKDLDGLGKDIQYIRYEGEGHEFARSWNDFAQSITEYFTENLR